MNYLRSFYNGKVLSASFGPAEIGGRLFYNDEFTALNFSAERAELGDVLDRIAAHLTRPGRQRFTLAQLL